jgi:dihydroneopterin aldolase
MGQIALEGMEFFAFHGYYDEEQKIGNKYGVDLYIQTDLHAAGTSDKLQETVNYEVLYRLVADEMLAPARLLEHLGHRVMDRILAQFPHVRAVRVCVSKFNPPLGGICRRARITLKRKRKEIAPQSLTA